MSTIQNHRIFLAGDALITQPWSHIDDPDFIKLVTEMREADTTIINLETLIHDYKGYAQANSGGAYMASPPVIASELKWAGVDMVSHANNHAFDYGPEGIIETHDNVDAAGIIIAGTGNDLQSARAPRYISNKGTTVALVSMASTLIPYGVASLTRSDLHGRPGLNPLRITKDKIVTITRKQADILRRIAERLGRHTEKFQQPEFLVRNMQLTIGEKNSINLGLMVRPADFRGNISSIEQAAAKADLTVVAIHAHKQGKWLRNFSYTAISKGADIIFVHGPHEVCGIELYKGKPIFYCMGDFVYQTDQISRLPTEAYERVGLGESATVEDFHANGKRFVTEKKRSVFEAFTATLDFSNGKLSQVRLLPVDLQFDSPYKVRGQPLYAKSEHGRRIIAEVAKLSSKFGTKIRYDAELNQGLVELSEPPPSRLRPPHEPTSGFQSSCQSIQSNLTSRTG